MKFSLGSQIRGEINSVLYGYPEFVFDRKPKPLINEIPVFVYHSIDPVSFERQLIFLKENGYRTLSADGFINQLIENEPVKQKAVLLTVDDGRSSFWRFGYPLLKKYDLIATLFIIPGRTPDASECRSNLFQFWGGESTLKEIYAIDSFDETLCCWPEIKEMFSSGVVNVESHTLFHKEVFVSSKLTNFIDSNTSFAPYNSPVSAYLKNKDADNEINKEQYYGLPLFKSDPLMKGRPALIVSPDVVDYCKSKFHNLGIKEKNGQKLKSKIRDELLKSNLLRNQSYQNYDEIFESLYEDLSKSKEMIHQRLGPKAGNHLCLPYSVGSYLAINAAKSIKIRSCFWGTIKGRRINRPGDDPFQIVRIKNDFIERLPGKGRKSLLSIYGMKIIRRMTGGHIF